MTKKVGKGRYIIAIGFFILIGFGWYLTEYRFNFQMVEQKHLYSIKPADWTRVAFFILATIFIWMALLRKKKVNKGFFLLIFVMLLFTACLSLRSLTINKTVGEATEHLAIFKVRTIFLKGLDTHGYCYAITPLTLNLCSMKRNEKIRIFRGIWPFNYDPKDIVNAMEPWTSCLKGDFKP